VFWQGKAQLPALRALMLRFLGATKAERLLQGYARSRRVATVDQLVADARLVQFVETQLAGAIGSASARVMVASVVEEEALDLDDVMRILDEASQLRAYSQALEDKSLSLERATQELREANDKLKSLDRLKDDFMSSVTHELRTPLTSIRAFAELMRDDEGMDAEQRQRFLDIIVTETERLTRLVNQVLDMAKIEAGAAEWHNAEVDLTALLQQAASSMAESFREREIALECLWTPAPVMVWGDADRLTQVVLNLLSNAAKYAPRQLGVVSLALQVRGGEVVVSVSDNGPGVPPDQQAKVFEKFRQVDGDEHYRPGGTGLGLPISREIVQHLGGRLWLESEPGQGACFAFALPLGSAAQRNE
jgi:signal transduction histidine kinase